MECDMEDGDRKKIMADKSVGIDNPYYHSVNSADIPKDIILTRMDYFED